MKNLAEMRKDEFDPKSTSDFLEKLSKDAAKVDKGIRMAAAREESLRRMRKHPRTGGCPHIPQRYL